MQWSSASLPIQSYVEDIANSLHKQLGERLISVILHGSLAMGSFYEPKSDIDVLAVMDGALEDDLRKKLTIMLVDLHERRPTLGGLEFSLLSKQVIFPFVHPLSFELHFGEEHPALVRAGGELPHHAIDADLAAHLTVAIHRGVALFGPPPIDVLPEVPWGAYVNSVRQDFDWIVSSENILETPFYGVLNICRTLQLIQEGQGTIASKEEGALWALEHLPSQYHLIMQKALNCYRSNASGLRDPPSLRRLGGQEWDRESLLAFRDYALTRIISLSNASI